MLLAVFVSAVLALTVPSTHGFVLGWGRCPDLPPVKDLNVTYWASGEWLETYRYPFFFTKGVSCGRARYSPQKDGTFQFTYDGRRDGAPIQTVDFLYLEQQYGNPADMKVFNEDYSYLPRLGYRIVDWKKDDPTSGGYFVQLSCAHVFGIFNVQNLSIFQRRVDVAQLVDIIEKNDLDWDKGTLNIALRSDCSFPQFEGSGYKPGSGNGYSEFEWELENWK